LAAFFAALDWAVEAVGPGLAQGLRKHAIDRCLKFVTERLNGENGLGAIYPAIANRRDDVRRAGLSGHACPDPAHPARRAVEKLLVVGKDEAIGQPCPRLPVWDTALACHALMEAGVTGDQVARGWIGLKPRQVLDVDGDWAEERRGVRPGGWAFQYNNAHYPDLDDTPSW